eukprot:771063-Prorocentrum_minimum.AAC.1
MSAGPAVLAGILTNQPTCLSNQPSHVVKPVFRGPGVGMMIPERNVKSRGPDRHYINLWQCSLPCVRSHPRDSKIIGVEHMGDGCAHTPEASACNHPLVYASWKDGNVHVVASGKDKCAC